MFYSFESMIERKGNEGFSFYYWFTSSAWSTIEKLVLRFEPRYSTHCVLEQLCSCPPSTNLARLVTKVTKEDRYLTFKYCTYRILLWFVVFLFFTEATLCEAKQSFLLHIFKQLLLKVLEFLLRKKAAKRLVTDNFCDNFIKKTEQDLRDMRHMIEREKEEEEEVGFNGIWNGYEE